MPGDLKPLPLLGNSNSLPARSPPARNLVGDRGTPGRPSRTGSPRRTCAASAPAHLGSVAPEGSSRRFRSCQPCCTLAQLPSSNSERCSSWRAEGPPLLRRGRLVGESPIPCLTQRIAEQRASRAQGRFSQCQLRLGRSALPQQRRGYKRGFLQGSPSKSRGARRGGGKLSR